MAAVKLGGLVMIDAVANGCYLPLRRQSHGSTLEEDVHMFELSSPGLLINFLSRL